MQKDNLESKTIILACLLIETMKYLLMHIVCVDMCIYVGSFAI